MSQDGKTKCTNCKCWRNNDSYIGSKGNVVKRCTPCREKDKRQKKRPDVIQKRNERQHEKQYYKAYRNKKRDRDEQAYLAHNAALAKQWRDKNKDHLCKWRTLNFRNRLGSIKQQALKKGIPWHESMTDDVCMAMMERPCFYCRVPMTSSLHGIDRADNNASYILDNCVTSCRSCNFMKKSLDPTTFIERCQHISSMHGGIGAAYLSCWRDSKAVSFTNYIARANKKQLLFTLKEEDYAKLINGACYYCRRESNNTHINGIDRMDNSQGYTLGNCVACCSECNQMKTTMTALAFIEQCKNVSRVWHDKENMPFPNIPRCMRVITKRKVMV